MMTPGGVARSVSWLTFCVLTALRVLLRVPSPTPQPEALALCTYMTCFSSCAGKGSCTLVPQIYDDRRHESVVHNNRSACQSYPTGVKSGLLWVFMTPGTDAHMKAMTFAFTGPHTCHLT
jgi:hypothetical protein